MTPLEQAQYLIRHGYIIVKGVDGASLRKKLEEMMMAAPEFIDHPSFEEVTVERGYILGGTAFAGSPSVFNNEVSLRWHDETAAYLMEMIQALAGLSGIREVKLARILHDRIQIRPAGATASAESFHRDLPGMMQEEEWCIGGFQNCDAGNQYFCGVKGSHTLTTPSGAGFSKIDQAGQKEYKARLAAQANQHDTDSKGKIIVPPGHLILFFSNMVHAVNASKVPYTSVKIFFGLRLTPHISTGMVGIDKRPLTYEAVVARMKANDVIPLGSGQTPAFYPGMYHVFPETLLPKAEVFVERMLVPGAMRYPIREANSRHDYTRSVKSLAELGLPLYTYRQDQFEAMLPQREVRIMNYKTGEIDTYPLIKDDEEVSPAKRARVE